MYSEKKVEFVIANEIRRDPKEVRRRQWRMRIGEWLAKFLAPVLKMQEHRNLHNIQNSRADQNGERLSVNQFLELQDFQETAMDLEARKKYFRSSDHTKTMHGIAPPLIETLIAGDPSIKSVLDIGCNYAYMDHVMAKRHPSIQFQGIDVPRELENVNEDLIVPNLKIRSGYALDYIEKQGVRADLVYFSSTAVTVRNPELRNYLSQIAQFAKYIVFSEPIYISPDGETENPDDMPLEFSLPTFLQIHFASNKRGYLSYAHNYRAMVEAAGFEVQHYRVFVPDFTSMHWVLLAGKNRNKALWS